MSIETMIWLGVGGIIWLLVGYVSARLINGMFDDNRFRIVWRKPVQPDSYFYFAVGVLGGGLTLLAALVLFFSGTAVFCISLVGRVLAPKK